MATVTQIATLIKLMEPLYEAGEDISHFIVEGSFNNKMLIQDIANINDAFMSLANTIDSITFDLSPEEQDQLDKELEELDDAEYDDLYDEEE